MKTIDLTSEITFAASEGLYPAIKSLDPDVSGTIRELLFRGAMATLTGYAAALREINGQLAKDPQNAALRKRQTQHLDVYISYLRIARLASGPKHADVLDEPELRELVATP